jgi:hypothetical protein
VGDQFAMLEAATTFALLLRRFEFQFGPQGSEAVGLRTGATIHTENGLWMRVKARKGILKTGHVWTQPSHPVLNPGGELLKRKLEAELKIQDDAVKKNEIPAAAASFTATSPPGAS